MIDEHYSGISPGLRGSRPTPAGGVPDGDTHNQAVTPFANARDPVRAATPATARASVHGWREGHPVWQEILLSRMYRTTNTRRTRARRVSWGPEGRGWGTSSLGAGCRIVVFPRTVSRESARGFPTLGLVEGTSDP